MRIPITLMSLAVWWSQCSASADPYPDEAAAYIETELDANRLTNAVDFVDTLCDEAGGYKPFGLYAATYVRAALYHKRGLLNSGGAIDGISVDDVTLLINRIESTYAGQLGMFSGVVKSWSKRLNEYAQELANHMYLTLEQKLHRAIDAEGKLTAATKRTAFINLFNYIGEVHNIVPTLTSETDLFRDSLGLAAVASTNAGFAAVHALTASPSGRLIDGFGAAASARHASPVFRH